MDQIAFIRSFQDCFFGLGGFFSAVAFLGMPEFYLLVIPLVLWCWNRTLGLRLLAFLSVSGALCDALKIAFHTPRPYWVSQDVKALSSIGSFGFPSAHAQNAVVFFGTIAEAVRRRGVWVACTILVLGIGLARIFQAVHFPTDILGGWAIGIFLLLGLIFMEKPIRSRFAAASRPALILLAFCGSLLLIALTGAALLAAGPWQVPASWQAMALARTGVPIDPFAARDTVLSAGILFGTIAGAVLCPDHVAATATGGSWSRKAARYIAGICVLFFLMAALSGFTKIPGTAGYIAVYLQAALAGFWIACGAPVLFARTGLAGPADETGAGGAFAPPDGMS